MPQKDAASHQLSVLGSATQTRPQQKHIARQKMTIGASVRVETAGVECKNATRQLHPDVLNCPSVRCAGSWAVLLLQTRMTIVATAQ